MKQSSFHAGLVALGTLHRSSPARTILIPGIAICSAALLVSALSESYYMHIGVFSAYELQQANNVRAEAFLANIRPLSEWATCLERMVNMFFCFGAMVLGFGLRRGGLVSKWAGAAAALIGSAGEGGIMNRCFPQAVILIGTMVILFGCSEKQADNKAATTPGATSLNEKISTQTVEGVASGFDCAVVDVLCPSTHRAADFTTGIFTDDKKFYFIVNIPQSYMTQYFLERLSVNGKVYHPYDKAVEPEQIYLLKNGGKKLVYEAGYFYDPQGHKAMFNQSRVVDGVWVCDHCAK